MPSSSRIACLDVVSFECMYVCVYGCVCVCVGLFVLQSVSIYWIVFIFPIKEAFSSGVQPISKIKIKTNLLKVISIWFVKSDPSELERAVPWRDELKKAQVEKLYRERTNVVSCYCYFFFHLLSRPGFFLVL